MNTEDPSSENFASSHWPRHSVLRSSAEPNPEASADLLAPQDIQIALSGGALQTGEELTAIITEKLQLPRFATRTPTTFANTLDRHLFVLAKTNRHLQIKLTQAEEVPEAVMTLLLQWVKRMPLRLLLIGAPSESASSSQLMQTLGIELLDLDDAREDAAELAERVDERVDELDLSEPETDNRELTDPELTDPEIVDPELVDPELVDPEIDELTLDDEIDDSLAEAVVPVDDNPVVDAHPTPSKNNLALGLAFAGLAAATVAWFFVAGEPEPSEAPPPVNAVVDREPLPTPSAELPEPELPEPEIAEVLPAPEPKESLAPARMSNATAEPKSSVEPKAIAKSELTSEPGIVLNPEPIPTGTPEAVSEPAPVPKAVYTIQIASYLSAELRDEYLQKPQAVASELRGAQSKSGGRFKSLVVHGAYSDYSSAAKAIKALPEALQKSQPFPIKVSGLVEGASFK